MPTECPITHRARGRDKLRQAIKLLDGRAKWFATKHYDELMKEAEDLEANTRNTRCVASMRPMLDAMIRHGLWVYSHPRHIELVLTKEGVCEGCQISLERLIEDVIDHEIGAMFGSPDYDTVEKIDAALTYEQID